MSSLVQALKKLESSCRVILCDGTQSSWTLAFVAGRDFDLYDDVLEHADELKIEQMANQELIDEGVCFIAVKDGVLGIIFESENPVIESDQDNEDFEGIELVTRAEMGERLRGQIKQVSAIYPQVEFCVVLEGMWDNRSGAWGFMPSGALDHQQQVALAKVFGFLGQKDFGL